MHGHDMHADMTYMNYYIGILGHDMHGHDMHGHRLHGFSCMVTRMSIHVLQVFARDQPCMNL